MNTLIYYSFNVLGLSLLILIVGMIKPKWIFLWMEKPGRMPVAMIAAVLFMIGMVMFGEGNKQLQQEKNQLTQKQEPASKAATDVPATHTKVEATPVTPPN